MKKKKKSITQWEKSNAASKGWNKLVRAHSHPDPTLVLYKITSATSKTKTSGEFIHDIYFI